MKPSREALALATQNLGKRADLELLLTAIRDDDEEKVLEAYVLWRERYPIDDIDIHAMKLVPRLVSRLHELGVKDSETGRLQGIGRWLLVHGHAQADAAHAAMDRLRAASIETMPIKGLRIRDARLMLPYERPMADADIVLKRPSEMGEAQNVLRRFGWKKTTDLEHATTLAKGKTEIDVHRFVLRDDRRFEFEVRDGDYTKDLIVTCLHGMRVDGGAAWIFDAEAFVKTGRVDWAELMLYAHRRRFVLAMAAALGRVRGVPEQVQLEIGRIPASHIEALELRHVTTPFERHGDKAARLLQRLRERSEVVDLRVHEEEPGLRWDKRWEKEWQ